MDANERLLKMVLIKKTERKPKQFSGVNISSMGTLTNLSISTAGVIFVATVLAADHVLAFTFNSKAHTLACDPNGCVTSISGATTIDFNDGTAPSSGFATYSYPSGTTIVRSTGQANVAAPPLGDTTPYVSIGPSPNASPVNITFEAPLDQFGLYWGSVDAYNSISFFRNLTDTTAFITYGGTAIIPTADGSQLTDENNPYVDFLAQNSNEYFSKVELSSTTQAFENDNHSYRRAAIPYELSPGLGSLVLAAWGVMVQLKRRVRKQKSEVH